MKPKIQYPETEQERYAAAFNEFRHRESLNGTCRHKHRQTESVLCKECATQYKPCVNCKEGCPSCEDIVFLPGVEACPCEDLCFCVEMSYLLKSLRMAGYVRDSCGERYFYTHIAPLMPDVAVWASNHKFALYEKGHLMGIFDLARITIELRDYSIRSMIFEMLKDRVYFDGLVFSDRLLAILRRENLMADL